MPKLEYVYCDLSKNTIQCKKSGYIRQLNFPIVFSQENHGISVCFMYTCQLLQRILRCIPK